MSKHTLPEIFNTATSRDLFTSLQREVDRVFTQFGQGFPMASDLGKSASRLKLNVAETEKDIEVTADLPGVDPANVSVELKDGVLTIKAERKEERDEKKKDYHLVERSYGAYERSVALPADVDADKAVAKFDKGVLSVSLAKKPGAPELVKKIAVKAA